MVATDVASRGIGMIASQTPTPSPSAIVCNLMLFAFRCLFGSSCDHVARLCAVSLCALVFLYLVMTVFLFQLTENMDSGEVLHQQNEQGFSPCLCHTLDINGLLMILTSP